MFTLSKQERLSGRNNFQTIFNNGKTIRLKCVTVRYYISNHEEKPPFRFAVAVPKKFMKRAHDRNYVKRLFRENLRHLKSEINEVSDKKIDCLFVYNSSEMPDYITIGSICTGIITQLKVKLQKWSE